jgi:hypothetical protein
MELAIHQCHLRLVFEVAHRPQSTNDDGGSYPLGEFGQQSVEGLKRDPVLIAYGRPKHLETLLDREKRLLHHIYGDRDNEAIGQPQAPANQIFMASGRRIERSGVHRDAGHGAWQKVMAVSP